MKDTSVCRHAHTASHRIPKQSALAASASLVRKRSFEHNQFNWPLLDVDQRIVARYRITVARGGHGNQRIRKLSGPVCAGSLRGLMGAWPASKAARAGRLRIPSYRAASASGYQAFTQHTMEPREPTVLDFLTRRKDRGSWACPRTSRVL